MGRGSSTDTAIAPAARKDPVSGGWRTQGGHIAQFPLGGVSASMAAQLKEPLGPEHPRVRERVQAVSEILANRAERGVSIKLPEKLISPMVELAEALPRIAARKDIHLPRCSANQCADLITYFATKQKQRTSTPPLLALQALYDQVSINGWNLRFENELDYSKALNEELPEDHRQRWHEMYLFNNRLPVNKEFPRD